MQGCPPVDALRGAGLAPGDELRAEAVGEGQVLLSRATDLVDRYAGCLPAGTFPPGFLERLRGEWRS